MVWCLVTVFCLNPTIEKIIIQHLNFVHLNYYYYYFFGLNTVIQIKTFLLSLKIYGAAVSFFEVLPEEQLTEERKKALQLNNERVRELLCFDNSSYRSYQQFYDINEAKGSFSILLTP